MLKTPATTFGLDAGIALRQPSALRAAAFLVQVDGTSIVLWCDAAVRRQGHAKPASAVATIGTPSTGGVRGALAAGVIVCAVCRTRLPRDAELELHIILCKGVDVVLKRFAVVASKNRSPKSGSDARDLHVVLASLHIPSGEDVGVDDEAPVEGKRRRGIESLVMSINAAGGERHGTKTVSKTKNKKTKSQHQKK